MNYFLLYNRYCGFGINITCHFAVLEFLARSFIFSPVSPGFSYLRTPYGPETGSIRISLIPRFKSSCNFKTPSPVVPNLVGTRDRFRGRQFFYGPVAEAGVGAWGGRYGSGVM